MLKITEFSHLVHISGRMLRYYDERGLLKPASVDPATGYRYYTLEQLPRFHRLQALKDLGFTLERNFLASSSLICWPGYSARVGPNADLWRH